MADDIDLNTTARAWLNQPGLCINGLYPITPGEIVVAAHPETGEPTDWCAWWCQGAVSGEYMRIYLRADMPMKITAHVETTEARIDHPGSKPVDLDGESCEDAPGS